VKIIAFALCRSKFRDIRHGGWKNDLCGFDTGKFCFFDCHDLGLIFISDHLNQVGADVSKIEYEAFDPTTGFKSYAHGGVNLW
jgi:hypothetical protein